MSRIKKMCGMGMLRRYVYVHGNGNIVLYSATPEFCEIIYQMLKLNTDARPEKDILPPIEIVERAAASLVACELMKSPYLSSYNFTPYFHDPEYGRVNFYCVISHTIDTEYMTIIAPLFCRIDLKRYTEDEWYQYLQKKVKALAHYMDYLEKEKNKRIQLIIVCEDTNDFKKASTYICTYMPRMLEKIYYTSEGALKSGSDLKNSMIRIVSTRQSEENPNFKILHGDAATLSYQFF